MTTGALGLTEWIEGNVNCTGDKEIDKADSDRGITSPQEAHPLSDEFLRKMHHEYLFGLFCDYDDFEQIARAIERAHGIKGTK